MTEAGISRDIGEPTYDEAVVTVQNIGGNKLDSYVHRSIHHACRIESQESTLCSTEVSIRNATPPGLTRFEYQYRPYGLFKNVVEIYVPAGADLLSVEVDGSPEDFFKNREDGLAPVGVYIEIPRGLTSSVRVEYELPTEDGYTLEVAPQPLVTDAHLSVDLAIPVRWEVDGPEGLSRGDSVHWEGKLDRRLRFEAGSSERSGLAALWQNIGHFMREPLL